jgi:hypothetical protein
VLHDRHLEGAKRVHCFIRYHEKKPINLKTVKSDHLANTHYMKLNFGKRYHHKSKANLDENIS